MAKWLHSAIESYALPRKLVGRAIGDASVPRRLFPLFRDRDELPTSSSLGDSLEVALSQSRSLIVLCSPHAAASRWVNEEILHFQRHGRGDRIVCVIVGGEPNAGSDTEATQREAFPEALRVVQTTDRHPSRSPADVPLAADLRPGGDGRHIALLKVVAGLLMLPLDELVARDQRRRRWRAVQATTALVVALLLGGGIWLNEYRKTQAQALATRAQWLLDGNMSQLPTAALLAVTAWDLALELNLAAEEVLGVMRRSTSLLPRPGMLRLKANSPLGSGVASADGRWMATRGDESVLLWDARSGNLMATLTTGGSVDALSFTRDGSKLVVVAGKFVQTWATASASSIGSQHIDGLGHPVSLSGDGRWLAAGLGSAVDVGTWDLATGTLTRRLRVDVPVTSLSISPDGRRLAAGVGGMSNSGAVDPGWRLWNLETGQLLIRGKAAGYIRGLAFDPRGRTLAVDTGTIEIRDAATGRELASFRGAGSALVWAPNERWLAGSDSPVQVWDAESGDEVARLPGVGSVVAFSTNGELITADGRSWAMNTTRQVEHLLASPRSGGVSSIRFAGPTRLATAKQSGEVATWELVETAARSGTVREGLAPRITAFSDDGRFLLTMNGNTLGSTWSARLWNTRTGRKLADIEPGGQIEDASFSTDGSQLAVVDNRGVVTVYATNDASIEAHVQVRTAPEGHRLQVVPGSPGWVILGGGAALFWSAGRDKPKYLNLGENSVHHVAASADGRKLWQAGQGPVIARDIVTLAEVHRIDIHGHIGALSVSRDGAVVAALDDRKVHVVDGRAGRLMFELSLSAVQTTLPEESGGVTGMTLSPDGRWLALVDQKRDASQNLVSDVSLWSIDRRTRVAVLAQSVQWAEFSNDGTRMAVIAGDGLVQLVDWIPTRLISDLCARIGRPLTASERMDHLVPDNSEEACR